MFSRNMLKVYLLYWPFSRTEAAFVNDPYSASGNMVGERAESEY